MNTLGFSENYVGEGNLGEDSHAMGNEIRHRRRGRKRKGISEKIEFENGDDLSGIFRIFSYLNPELFVEKVKTRLEITLEQIQANFGPRIIDERITEVSCHLPDTFDITIGELNILKTYPEREVSVNGFRFRIWQEQTNKGNFGGKIPVCKIQPIFQGNTPFLLPDELEINDDTKDLLNNRAGKINSWISNKEGIFILDGDTIGKWLHEMFLEYKKLTLGHTFQSLTQDTLLRRNYGFLVWLILHYNISLQK